MEGPSLLILKEELKKLKGRKIISTSGVSKIDQSCLAGQKIKAFDTWGKHFIIVFKEFFIRIHFLMFGSYRLNEQKPARLMLGLIFDDAQTLNFYSCAIRLHEGKPENVYDWQTDVMRDEWNAAKARRTLKKRPDRMVCDALLDQDIFSGVGNIIKNEVLFRIHIHPETKVGDLPPRKLTALITEAREYSFDFYNWKKIYQLKKHWLIYSKRFCPRCKIPVMRKPTGIGKRRSFYCESCQQRYR